VASSHHDLEHLQGLLFTIYRKFGRRSIAWAVLRSLIVFFARAERAEVLQWARRSPADARVGHAP
jgi:hypothetical protein